MNHSERKIEELEQRIVQLEHRLNQLSQINQAPGPYPQSTGNFQPPNQQVQTNQQPHFNQQVQTNQQPHFNQQVQTNQPSHFNQQVQPNQPSHFNQQVQPNQPSHFNQQVQPNQPSHFNQQVQPNQQSIPVQPLQATVPYSNREQTFNQPIYHQQYQYNVDAQSNIHTPAKASRSFENLMVTYILPNLFIVLLFLGIVMFFTAGIVYELISEQLYFIFGVCLTIMLYMIGILLQRRSSHTLAKTIVLFAYGISFMTISVSHLDYAVINALVAAVLYSATIAMLAYFARKWSSQLLNIFYVIGSYAAIIILSLPNHWANLVVPLLLLITIGFTLQSMRGQGHARITYCFTYLLFQIALIVSFNMYENIHVNIFISALILHHLLLAWYFINKKEIHPEFNVSLMASVFITLIWLYSLTQNNAILSFTPYLIIALILAIGYITIGYFLKHKLTKLREQVTDEKHIVHLKKSLQHRISLAIIISTITALAFLFELLGNSYIAISIYVLGTAVLMFGLYEFSQLLRWFGGILKIIGIFLIFVQFPSELLSLETFNWSILIIGVSYIYYEITKFDRRLIESLPSISSEKNIRPLHYTLLIVIKAFWWLLTFLYITQITLLMTNNIEEDLVYPFILSLVWLLYAIVAITFGSIKKKYYARLTGIILLLIIVVKVIFFDITFISILYKSILFTVLGCVGIIISLSLSKKLDSN